MICNECNSEPYNVVVQQEIDVPGEFYENLDANFCPFCGSNLEWAQRGGFDADEYDDNRLDL
jgi:hypothetical protein